MLNIYLRAIDRFIIHLLLIHFELDIGHLDKSKLYTQRVNLKEQSQFGCEN